MVEDTRGQTFVTTGGADAFTAAAKGSVYTEFKFRRVVFCKEGK